MFKVKLDKIHLHKCYQMHNICVNFPIFLHKCYRFDNICSFLQKINAVKIFYMLVTYIFYANGGHADVFKRSYHKRNIIQTGW